MPLSYRAVRIGSQEGLEAAAYEGSARQVEVPAMAEGLPVLSVGKSAFSDVRGLEEVILPETLLSLGSFAFSHCDDLRRLSMYDGITEVYDGAIRTCRGLTDVCIRMKNGRYGLIRSLLADGNGKRRFELELPAGRLCLVFPEFSNDYVIDTLAKTHHATLEGCGSAYRECVRRDGIRLEEYDSLFYRAKLGDLQTAAELAEGRLSCPLELKEAARAEYTAFLTEHAEALLRAAFERETFRIPEMFLRASMFTEESLTLALMLASGKGLTEWTARLMAYRQTHFQTKKETKLSLF